MKAHTINLVSAIELAQASTSMGVTRIYLAGGAHWAGAAHQNVAVHVVASAFRTRTSD